MTNGQCNWLFEGVEPTNRRKLAVSVLALGVAALVVDRFVLGPGNSGPASVNAETALVQEPAAKPSPAARSASASLAQRLKAIAVDLDRAEQAKTMGPPAFSDAFAVPVAWKPAEQPDAKGREKPAPADPSMPEVKLTSLSKVMAVINGAGLQVGESVSFGEGKSAMTVKLVSIDIVSRTAVAEVQGKAVTLELQRGASSK